jgi:hypothetical protein
VVVPAERVGLPALDARAGDGLAAGIQDVARDVEDLTARSRPGDAATAGTHQAST